MEDYWDLRGLNGQTCHTETTGARDCSCYLAVLNSSARTGSGLAFLLVCHRIASSKVGQGLQRNSRIQNHFSVHPAMND